MKYFILIVLIAVNAFAVDVLQVTPDMSFNYFFTLIFYLMIGLVAFLGVATFFL